VIKQLPIDWLKNQDQKLIIKKRTRDIRNINQNQRTYIQAQVVVALDSQRILASK